MIHSIKKRIIPLSLLLGGCLLTLLVTYILDASLQPTSLFTGAFLIGLCILLALFNMRKKLPFIPLLKASTWMQFHIYMGYFTVLVFLIHIQFRVPNGIFEITLAVIFLIVAISGVFGLFLSSYLPRRMTQSGESLIYEKMPGFRYKILKEVEELLLQAEKETGSSTLTDYYMSFGADFFNAKPRIFHALHPSYSQYSEVSFRLRDIYQHLTDEDEKQFASELRAWIDTKKNLDFQESSQRLLKGWLFIHIPLTYSLLLLGIVHGFSTLLFMDVF